MSDPFSISLNDVKQVSSVFLDTYCPSRSLPIPIDEIIEINLGIRIILIPKLVSTFGVNAFITQTFDSIVIDEDMFSKQPNRIRFTLAEEIGHLFLHKEWYQSNGPKGVEGFLDWHENLDNKLYAFIERQARTFASMILMPEEMVVSRWKAFAQNHGLSTPCSVYDLPDTYPNLVTEFEVSLDSFLVRLNVLKLVQFPDGFWEKIKRK